MTPSEGAARQVVEAWIGDCSCAPIFGFVESEILQGYIAAAITAAVETERETIAQRLKFPTMLRKMWSGREVQEWIDEAIRARGAAGGGDEH